MINNKYKNNRDHKQTCPKCKSAIWKTQIEGLERSLSIMPLDLLGELKAKIARRPTFSIKISFGKLRGHFRYPYHMKAERKPLEVVVTIHVCGEDYATTHPEYETRVAYVIPEEPEF